MFSLWQSVLLSLVRVAYWVWLRASCLETSQASQCRSNFKRIYAVNLTNVLSSRGSAKRNRWEADEGTERHTSEDQEYSEKTRKNVDQEKEKEEELVRKMLLSICCTNCLRHTVVHHNLIHLPCSVQLCFLYTITWKIYYDSIIYNTITLKMMMVYYFYFTIWTFVVTVWRVPKPDQKSFEVSCLW